MCLFIEFLMDMWPVTLFLILIFIIMPILMFWALPEKSVDTSIYKIRNDDLNHTCKNCNKKFTFYIRDLYLQYGNCGGYENGLYVDCPECRAINQPYKES